MGATLQRPVLRRYASLAAHQPAGIPQPRAAGAGGDKRAYPGGGGSGGEAKKLKARLCLLAGLISVSCLKGEVKCVVVFLSSKL